MNWMKKIISSIRSLSLTRSTPSDDKLCQQTSHSLSFQIGAKMCPNGVQIKEEVFANVETFVDNVTTVKLCAFTPTTFLNK